MSTGDRYNGMEVARKRGHADPAPTIGLTNFAALEITLAPGNKVSSDSVALRIEECNTVMHPHLNDRHIDTIIPFTTGSGWEQLQGASWVSLPTGASLQQTNTTTAPVRYRYRVTWQTNTLMTGTVKEKDTSASPLTAPVLQGHNEVHAISLVDLVPGTAGVSKEVAGCVSFVDTLGRTHQSTPAVGSAVVKNLVVTSVCPVGGTLPCQIEDAININDWTQNTSAGWSYEPVTYTWSCTAGTFDHPNAQTPVWTAPTTPGKYTLTCTISDTKGFNQNLVRSVSVNVSAPPAPPDDGSTASIHLYKGLYSATQKCYLPGNEIPLGTDPAPTIGLTNFAALEITLDPGERVSSNSVALRIEECNTVMHPHLNDRHIDTIIPFTTGSGWEKLQGASWVPLPQGASLQQTNTTTAPVRYRYRVTWQTNTLMTGTVLEKDASAEQLTAPVLQGHNEVHQISLVDLVPGMAAVSKEVAGCVSFVDTLGMTHHSTPAAGSAVVKNLVITNVCPTGGTLPCQIEDATNINYWTQNTSTGSSYEPVTYTWSCTAGTFDHPNAQAPVWTAPTTPGRYTLTCTISDTKGLNQSLVRSVSVNVAAPPAMGNLMVRQPDGSWADATAQTLYAPVGGSLTFEALPTSGTTWPAGEPVWGGVASGQGPQATVTFNMMGGQKVTATYGTATAVALITVQAQAQLVAIFSDSLTTAEKLGFDKMRASITEDDAAGGPFSPGPPNTSAPVYCAGIDPATVTSQFVAVKFWYDNQTEAQATSLRISAGLSTTSITEQDWRNAWGQSPDSKQECDDRGSVIVRLNGAFYEGRVFFLKFVIAGGGVLDNNGNPFNAVDGADPPEKTIILKMLIDETGKATVIETIYS